VCGSLKCEDVNDLKEHATTVGTLAAVVLKNPTFKKSYSDDERKQVATLISQAVDTFNETSTVEAEADFVDEPATGAKPTLKALLHQHLNAKWFKRVDDTTRWRQSSRKAVRENVCKYLEQSTGVTSTKDMYTGEYANRADVETLLDMLKTNGRTLVDSTIELARGGEFDVKEHVLEAMKKAVETVVPVLWLAIFDEVCHNRSYLGAQPIAARVRTRAV